MRIGQSEFRDCGYPYTIEREDGKLVTAWYAKISKGYHYEMRITLWDPDAVEPDVWKQFSGPKGKTPDDVTLDEALGLLAAKADAPRRGRRRRLMRRTFPGSL